MSRRKTAKELLTHYIRKSWNFSNHSFRPDNYAEVEGIVDAIFDEIDDLRKELKRVTAMTTVSAENVEAGAAVIGAKIDRIG